MLRARVRGFEGIYPLELPAKKDLKKSLHYLVKNWLSACKL